MTLLLCLYNYRSDYIFMASKIKYFESTNVHLITSAESVKRMSAAATTATTFSDNTTCIFKTVQPLPLEQPILI